MPSNVSIRPAALAEMRQHVFYLHHHASPRIAERFVDVAYKCFQLLSSIPEMGAEIPVRRAMLSGMRCWPLKKPFQKYVIYYRILRSTIEIVHLLHGSQDSASILDED